MPWMHDVLVALTVAGLAASPAGCAIEADYGDTSFACADSERCPPGFSCSGGVCVPDGAADAGQDCDGAGSMELVSSALSGGEEVWETTSEGGAAVEVGGDEVAITLPAQAASAGAIRSRCGYDLTGARIFVELVSPPDSGRAHFEAGSRSGDDTLAFEIDDGRLLMVFEQGGNRQQASISYDEEDHRFLAVSEQGGFFVFETSASGSSWLAQRSHEAPDFIGEIALRFAAEAEAPAAPETIGFQGLRGDAIDR